MVLMCANPFGFALRFPRSKARDAIHAFSLSYVHATCESSNSQTSEESHELQAASKAWLGRRTRMDATITTKDLKAKLDRKEITVVETLAPERYREAHIPGALNIPPERIKELAPELLPNKNAEIITYCTNNH